MLEKSVEFEISASETPVEDEVVSLPEEESPEEPAEVSDTENDTGNETAAVEVEVVQDKAASILAEPDEAEAASSKASASVTSVEKPPKRQETDDSATDPPQARPVDKKTVKAGDDFVPLKRTAKTRSYVRPRDSTKKPTQPVRLVFHYDKSQLEEKPEPASVPNGKDNGDFSSIFDQPGFKPITAVIWDAQVSCEVMTKVETPQEFLRLLDAKVFKFQRDGLPYPDHFPTKEAVEKVIRNRSPRKTGNVF